MKFYVAAKFCDKDRVRKCYDLLKSQGHSITCEWVEHEQSFPFSVNYELASYYAQKDFDGVLNADVFVVLSNDQPSLGAAAETGAAIAMYLKFGAPQVFVVGPHFDMNFAYWHPCVKRVESLEGVLLYLNKPTEKSTLIDNNF